MDLKTAKAESVPNDKTRKRKRKHPFPSLVNSPPRTTILCDWAPSCPLKTVDMQKD